MKTKIFTAIFFLFLSCSLTGQHYKFVYYLDPTLNSTSKESAVILGKAYEKNGYLLLDGFLTSTGKLVITAGVKDSTLSILHGPFKTYYDDLTVESEGNYTENEMDGLWKYWDTRGLLTDSMIYVQGIRVSYGSYKYYFSKPTVKQIFANPYLKDTLNWYRYSFTDSLKNTFTEKEVSVIDGKERLNFEVEFIGERGLLKEYDSTGMVKTDSVFTRKLQEPVFPGGEEEWRIFLQKTLNANVPAQNNAPAGQYLIIMKFIVNKDGILEEIQAESDPGYGMVAEAMRVLKSSPKWQPASGYGKYQRVFRRQPITFLVEGK